MGLMTADQAATRRALQRWRLRLLRRRHLHAWNGLLLILGTWLAWARGAAVLGALGLPAAVAPAAGAEPMDAMGLLSVGGAALGVAASLGFVMGSLVAWQLLVRSSENLLLFMHPVGVADLTWLRSRELALINLVVWVPFATALTAASLQAATGSGVAVAVAVAGAAVLWPMVTLASVAAARLVAWARSQSPVSRTSSVVRPRGWALSGVLAALTPLPLGRAGRMLLRRDLALLLRGAYPRTLLLAAMALAGVPVTLLALSGDAAPEERLVFTFIGGSFAAALSAWLAGVDLPRWRGSWSLGERLAPLRGSSVRLASSALASLFAMPAAVAPALAVAVMHGGTPLAEVAGLCLVLAITGMALAWYAAAFGLSSGAHTPRMEVSGGGLQAGSSGGEIAAYPMSAAALALVMGVLGLVWSSVKWAALPLLFPLLIRSVAHGGERVWERAEVIR